MLPEQNKYFIPEEIQLQAKRGVEEVKFRWTNRGQFDIFDIVSERAILIRKPVENAGSKSFSGFSTYMEEHFVVFLNTAFSVGHQRFTAVHELYHLEFDTHYLSEHKVMDETDELNKTLAQAFASEFLMPEDAVKEYYYKHLKNMVLTPIHIIRMHNEFRVSYKAMLVKLLRMEFIRTDEFDELKKMGTMEMKEEFQALTKSQGYDTSLIEPTNEASFPSEYLHYILDNYKSRRISYGRLHAFLQFINKRPENFGIIAPEEDEI